ncbi:MAG: leucine-rich repeat domain-containing protein [Ruminococcaceae bacterium]|nr:leucine-rich repeat domain-containing protein [Oscillospiraceae bacterium]
MRNSLYRVNVLMKKACVLLMTLSLIFLTVSCGSNTKKEDLSFEVVDNTIVIKGYNGSDPYLNIPDKIDGIKVVEIEENAFKDNSVIEKVKLPDTVTKLGDSCFSGCGSLKEVYISENVDVIPDSCFSYSSSIEKITAKGAKECGSFAFSGLDSLMTLEISEELNEELSSNDYNAVSKKGRSCEIKINGKNVTVEETPTMEGMYATPLF